MPLSTTASFASLLAGRPDEPAYLCLGHHATRAELTNAADHTAGYLKSLGIVRGDAICVWMPDGGAWLQILFAAARLGVLVVPVSTRFRFEEALHVVKTAQARLIFVQPQFVGYDYWDIAHQIKGQVASVRAVIAVDEPARLLDHEAYVPVRVDEGMPGDLLCTFSTSGTTGNPKLATHSQWGIFHHAQEVARFTDVMPGDTSLCALPLYGVLGFVQAFSALAGSAKCVFMQTFNTERAARLLDEHRCTHFYGGEGLFDDIISVAGCRATSLKTVGFAEFAGRGFEVTQKAERHLGLRMIALYGSSECFAIMAGQIKSEDAKARAIPGGQPICDEIAFRVADIESGAMLADQEKGELQFKGYNVMAGYLNNAAATADAFTADGWFRSGDLGYRYGAKFAYISRIKDTLRLRGYLVDPVEIEEYLARHPGVLDAQVVAWRHPDRGDVAVAFVRKTDTSLDEATLHQHCRAGLANYKVPSHVVFVDDYPRKEGPNGLKILKNKIRDMAKDIVLNADRHGDRT